jgi:hypothetical protein
MFALPETLRSVAELQHIQHVYEAMAKGLPRGCESGIFCQERYT